VIEAIAGAPDGVLAFRAIGTVEASDYEDVLKPAVEAAIEEQGSVRLVYELGTAYDGYSAGGAWEDLKLGVPHLTKWKRCAVVTDHRLIADALRAFSILMPGDVKAFPTSELDAALRWAAE